MKCPKVRRTGSRTLFTTNWWNVTRILNWGTEGSRTCATQVSILWAWFLFKHCTSEIIWNSLGVVPNVSIYERNSLCVRGRRVVSSLGHSRVVLSSAWEHTVVWLWEKSRCQALSPNHVYVSEILVLEYVERPHECREDSPNFGNETQLLIPNPHLPGVGTLSNLNLSVNGR